MCRCSLENPLRASFRKVWRGTEFFIFLFNIISSVSTVECRPLLWSTGQNTIWQDGHAVGHRKECGCSCPLFPELFKALSHPRLPLLCSPAWSTGSVLSHAPQPQYSDHIPSSQLWVSLAENAPFPLTSHSPPTTHPKFPSLWFSEWFLSALILMYSLSVSFF